MLAVVRVQAVLEEGKQQMCSLSWLLFRFLFSPTRSQKHYTRYVCEN
jgi:hypothetical protein